jgi:hypothetical protein
MRTAAVMLCKTTSQGVEFAALLLVSKINRNFNSLAVFSSVPCKFVIGSFHQNRPEASPLLPCGLCFFSHNQDVK